MNLAQYPPLILTFEQLKRVLQPLTAGYPWGEGTIHDLWKIGAPTPDSGPGQPEKRIIIPAQLGKWLGDVLARQGRPLSEAAKIYSSLQFQEKRRDALPKRTKNQVRA